MARIPQFLRPPPIEVRSHAPDSFDPLTRDEALPGDHPSMPPRPPRTRRPHGDGKVAQVRRLIVESTYTYAEIEAQTGVGRASICRWARDGGWKRPVFAPRATDTVPRARTGQKLKLRLLAERLRALAERHVRELEDSTQDGQAVDPDKLIAALELLKMARLEAMGRRRRRKPCDEGPRTGAWAADRREAQRRAVREMRRGGVDIDKAPAEAIDLVIDANLPPDDHPGLHRRGRWHKFK